MNDSKISPTRIASGIILFILMLPIIGVIVFADIYVSNQFVSMLWFAIIPAVFFVLNYILSKSSGAEIYDTGIVDEGETVFDIERTPAFYKRKMIFSFIQSGIFILLIGRFAVLRSMLGITGCIIACIIFFGIGVQSYNKSKPDETKVIENISNKANNTVKFKFNMFPSLKPKYEDFKYWNNLKEESNDNEEKANAVVQCNIYMDVLAEEVYYIFINIKPVLYDIKSNSSNEWNDIIDKPFDQLNYKQKLILARLVDASYLYKLHDEYYN